MIISLVNQKDEVGKTTLVINITWCLFLLDTDLSSYRIREGFLYRPLKEVLISLL